MTRANTASSGRRLSKAEKAAKCSFVALQQLTEKESEKKNEI